MRLEPGLHPTLINVVFAMLGDVPGVIGITDLAAIDRQTLDVLLLPTSPKSRRPKRSGTPR